MQMHNKSRNSRVVLNFQKRQRFKKRKLIKKQLKSGNLEN